MKATTQSILTSRFGAAPCVLVVAGMAIGCGSEAPPFPRGQGQVKGAGQSYPSGPYGVTRGSVISNYEFVGFPRPLDETKLVPIRLADFYNPTGDGVYPDDSPIAPGEPLPKALLLDVSAVWCQPCQVESKTILPKEYEEYGPRGAEFLLLLSESAAQGVPASEKDLKTWTSEFDLVFPSVIDPDYTLGSLFVGAALPTNIVIDTRTMKIAELVSGIPKPDSPLYTKLEELLDDES
jgi:hypothetical protein